MTARIASEEDLIRRFLAPLAAGVPGALDLRDDCALVAVPAGETLVASMDAVAAGVHFIGDEPAADIAWKALAVNVSDLAGKGARPLVYLMALSFPEAPCEDWLTGFASGLAEAQHRFGIRLVGGDTDRRPGPLTITITALGSVPSGRMVRRSTAGAGDRVFVSGTLGDAALGLAVLRDPRIADAAGLDLASRDSLTARYRRPEPRLPLREALRSCSTAAMDLSDGLAKDLARLVAASGCGARVEAGRVPLSEPARRIVAADTGWWSTILAGGDDFEILATVRPDHAAQFCTLAESAGIAVTEIGRIIAGSGVEITDPAGRVLALERAGWDHFATRWEHLPIVRRWIS
ncbi:MAG: thiamine-phosphate kinase [Hyphomicrobium sp.]